MVLCCLLMRHAAMHVVTFSMPDSDANLPGAHPLFLLLIHSQWHSPFARHIVTPLFV